MNILAAFFLFGLLLSGLKVLFAQVLISLHRFNETGSLILSPVEIEQINLLSVASNETNRRDTNFIRITSTRDSNDRMKRLAQPKRVELPDFKPGFGVAHARVN